MIYLLRHGEVLNPDHVVYADLDGFGLSERGWSQAESAAAYLGQIANEEERVGAIISSPLQRALETAGAVAERLRLPVSIDERLTEWRLSGAWAGLPWDELPTLRPGQLEAYLDHPTDLPFSPESIHEVATRVSAVAREVQGNAVLVSHQDPIQAARLRLTGRPLTTLHRHKPGHASVTILCDDLCCELGYWEPDQDATFPPVAR